MHIQINRMYPNKHGFRFRICPLWMYGEENRILGRPFYSKQEGLELIERSIYHKDIPLEMCYHLACTLLKSSFIFDFLVSSQKSDQESNRIEYLTLKSYLWEEVFADFLQEIFEKELQMHQVARKSFFIGPFFHDLYPWTYAVYHIKETEISCHQLGYTIYGYHLLETLACRNIITFKEMWRLKTVLKKAGLPWAPHKNVVFITEPTAQTILTLMPLQTLHAQ